MLADNKQPLDADFSHQAPTRPFSSGAKSADRFWPEIEQIENGFDISNGTLWSFMDFRGRPSYNIDLLEDFHGWQRNISALKEEVGDALKFVVLGSHHPTTFCLGGDLDYFSQSIEDENWTALRDYGLSCVSILYRNWRALDEEIITIGLAQGDALGGGFESLLSFDVIVAEKGTKFGFPERLFGLFPGMGALSYLGRKVGFAKAEWFVRSGKTVTAEELREMGLVHILVEPGKGVEAVQKYVRKHQGRHRADFMMNKAAKRANPIPYEELADIVELWVEACKTLSKHDLAVMRRLVSAQGKIASSGKSSEAA